MYVNRESIFCYRLKIQGVKFFSYNPGLKIGGGVEANLPTDFSSSKNTLHLKNQSGGLT